MLKKSFNLFIVLFISTILVADGVQPEGSGTQTNPYQVESLDNLLWISTNNSSWNSHFVQTSDIDASNTQYWNNGSGFNPIGEEDLPTIDNPFTGIYNGSGFTINHLYINGSLFSENIGLFGYTDGCDIQNLGVINVSISGSYYVGGLAGLISNSTINNCYTTGCISSTTNAGGFVGFSSESTISNCYSLGNVTGNSRIGGFIGYSYNDSNINNCFSSGNALGNEESGGFVGKNKDSYINYCFSSGLVTGYNEAGGFVGYNQDGSILNSFWDTETSNQTTSDGGTGKTTVEMQNIATYTSLVTTGLDDPWDFVGNPFDDIGNEDFWDIDAGINNGYPYLANTVVDVDELIIHNPESIVQSLNNYPNPFNPSTTINFSIQNNFIVEISIFNIKGQKVKTLISNEMGKGNHTIIWNGDEDSGKSVSSGIYYYKLNVNGKSEAVKKCLLLK